jgi:hypothetical protein
MNKAIIFNNYPIAQELEFQNQGFKFLYLEPVFKFIDYFKPLNTCITAQFYRRYLWQGL